LVLQGLSWKECLAYVDDIIVLGKDFREHLENLDKVLARFRKYILKLKPTKYNLFQSEVGKIVSREGIKINPENVETINKWTVPKTKKDVEFFLGFMNYQRAHSRIFWFSIATS
jgi:hypothetical protein